MRPRHSFRAIDPSREEGHSDTVYVADLRVASLDGSYPVHMMTREDFDALALTRREKGDKLTLATVPSRDAGTAEKPGSARSCSRAGNSIPLSRYNPARPGAWTIRPTTSAGQMNSPSTGISLEKPVISNRATPQFRTAPGTGS